MLATLVHLTTATFAALGIVLVWPGSTTWEKCLGALCLGIAYVLRPRFPRAASGPGLLDVRDCPETAAMVGEVAALVGSPVPTQLEVSRDLNAHVVLTGLRGRLLSVGAPLWVALGPQERLALLAHELGHLANGDALQWRYVSTAYDTLRRWEEMLGQGVRRELPVEFAGFDETASGQASVSVLSDIAAVLLWPVRVMIAGYRRLLEVVAAPITRWQERYADLASARVAGTAAAVASLEVQLAVVAVHTAANRAAVRREDLGSAIAQRMASFDAAERKAARLAADAGTSRVDDSHPPTLERLRHVESAERFEAAVHVAPECWARIDAEWSAALAQELKRLGDDYRYVH